MYNLELYYIDPCKFEDPLLGKELCCHFAEKVFSIYNDDEKIYINVRSAPEYKITNTVTLPKEGFYSMASLEFNQMLFVCTTSKIICFSLNLEQLQEIELQEDILTGKWNPTNDVFAILHASGKVGLYSLDFNLGELYLIASTMDLNPMEHVDIGWGTQEQNRTGDYKCSDVTPYIDWKDNSELFCINAINVDGHREIRVYNQQCEFLYKTESKIEGLESKVAFKPVGNMIACVISKTGVDQTVALIEKNGELRFELPMMTKGKILELQWSPCSLCLAIHQKDEKEEWLDLYLSMNLKFVLKQRMLIPQNNTLHNISFRKVLTNMFSLQLFLNDGLYTYRFIKKISRSCNFDGDRGTTSIISGNKLITYFYQDGITAPDSEAGHNFIITNKYPINAVIYAQHEYMFAIVDCENNVFIYNYNDINNCERSILFNIGKGSLHIPLSFYRFYFDLNDKFFAIGVEDNVNTDFSYTYQLNEDMVSRSDKIKVDKHIIYAAFEAKNSIQPKILTAKDSSIPMFYNYVLKLEETPYLVQIDAMGTIHINDNALKGCYTSLFSNRKFILATKSRPEEAEMPVDKLVSVQITKGNLLKIHAEKYLECCAYQRSIEQGATIINTIGNTPLVILYMPRGNLETIEVRNVAVLKIKEYLDEGNFKEALRCINLYSLRLDLIFDLDPNKFLNETETIFKIMESTGCLKKFLTELRDENSLSSEDFPYITIPNIPNRKQRIASAFESIFMSFNEPQRNLPILILASFINTKSVEETILLLSQTARRLEASSDYVIQSLNLLSRHIEHRQIYNAALSCFDIKLAEMIAKRSQMDPRIYKAFIFRIQSMDVAEQRFTMLNEVGNYKRAVLYYLYMHRKRLVTDETLLAYALEKNVIEALYYYCLGSDLVFRTVAEVYLTELKGQRRFKDMAIVLNRLGRHRDSVESFLKVAMWQEAITVINSNSLSLGDRRTLTRIVATYLREIRHFGEAASLFLYFVNDVQAALQCYMDGHLYAEALKIIHDEHSGRLEAVVIESIEYYCLQLTTKVQQMRLDYITYYGRLNELRTDKLLVDTTLEEPHDELYSDLESVLSASTTKSTMSTRSNRSVARRQRKEERKFLNLKKGSKYEDIAIMVELYNIASKTAEMFKEVDTIYMSLMIRYYGCDIIAIVQTLHVQINDLQTLISDTCEDVWKSHFSAYSPKPDDKGAYDNVVLLESKYRSKPSLYVPTATFPDYQVNELPF